MLSSTDTAPGAPLTYTISVSNQGLIAAEPGQVGEPAPSRDRQYSLGCLPNTVALQAGTRYTWEIDQLAVGETYTFTVTGQFSPGLATGTPLLLIASASTTTPEVNLGNNQATDPPRWMARCLSPGYAR